MARRRRLRKNQQGTSTAFLLLGVAGAGVLAWHLLKKNGSPNRTACEQQWRALQESEMGQFPPGTDMAAIRGLYMKHCEAASADQLSCYRAPAFTGENPPPECMRTLMPFMGDMMGLIMGGMVDFFGPDDMEQGGEEYAPPTIDQAGPQLTLQPAPDGVGNYVRSLGHAWGPDRAAAYEADRRATAREQRGRRQAAARKKLAEGRFTTTLTAHRHAALAPRFAPIARPTLRRPF